MLSTSVATKANNNENSSLANFYLASFFLSRMNFFFYFNKDKRTDEPAQYFTTMKTTKGMIL